MRLLKTLTEVILTSLQQQKKVAQHQKQELRYLKGKHKGELKTLRMHGTKQKGKQMSTLW